VTGVQTCALPSSGTARLLDRILVEEVRPGLLDGGRRTGRRCQRLPVGGRRAAGARYPRGPVPVPDISGNGRIGVVPCAGLVVAWCRGWGAHVRRPVSARGGSGGSTSIRPAHVPGPVPPDPPLRGTVVVTPDD